MTSPCPVCGRERCEAQKDPNPYREEMFACWKAAGHRLAKMAALETELADLRLRVAAAQSALRRHHAREHQSHGPPSASNGQSGWFPDDARIE